MYECWFEPVSQWIRAMGGPDADREDLPAERGSPAADLEIEEKRAMLERLLDRSNDSERAALVLFEIDGCSGVQRRKNRPTAGGHTQPRPRADP